MKASLHFNLPEENSEHQLALAAADLARSLSAVADKIRSKLKYSELSAEQIAVLEEVREEIDFALLSRIGW